jgi:hypothetical protein
MPDPNSNPAQAKMEAAKQAFERKRFDEAKQLLSEAEKSGAPRQQVSRLRQAVRAMEEHQEKMGRNSHWFGLLLGGLAYFILLFIPLTPRDALWVLLALLAVPGLVGGVIGRRMGYDAGRGPRFRKAAWVCGFVMFGYAFVSLILQRARFDLGSDAGQVFLVWIVASLGYALVAGLVAGLVSGMLTWGIGGRSAHGTAS